MKTPNKPLFIIDESQLHGRGTETKWVSCTSGSCPFIAIVTVIDSSEYIRHYNPDDVLTAYSHERGGIRLMAHVTNIQEGYDAATLRTLLRKLMKELEKRHAVVEMDVEEPSDEAALKFIEVLQGQNYENLREEPENPIHRQVFALLRKIKKDYSDGQS
jgi:hypothetical protein